MQHIVKQVTAEQSFPQGFARNLQSFTGCDPGYLGFGRALPGAYSLNGGGAAGVVAGATSTACLSLV